MTNKLPTKKQSEDFQILTPRAHIRQKTGMYGGSVSYEETERFVLGKFQKVRYVPALLKLIDEIIDNSLDEAIRSNFEYANMIDVSIEGNSVTVSDNGRGIPQDEVVTPEGKRLLRPVAAWTVTNAGTSFGTERTTIGSHGIGAAMVTYLSTSFVGKTWRQGSQVVVDSKDGCDPDIKGNPKVKQSEIADKSSSGTIVKFEPDFSLFECKSIEPIIEDLVMDRLISMAICFPEISFKFNKRKVGGSNFTKYLKMYGEHSVIFGGSYEFQGGFTNSEDGFRTNSYINGVHNILGGSYVQYITDSVADELIPMIKRKYKINVTKQMIKSHLTYVQFANSFVNPKFDSQTKERLTNTQGEVKAHFNQYAPDVDIEKIAKKIISNQELIDPIIQAELAKRLAAESRAAAAAQKNLKKAKVANHVKAKKPGGSFAVCEGLSAFGRFVDARGNNDTQGCLPLKGVIMNVWKEPVTKILSNKELSEIISCLELDINDPDSVDNSYYKDIWILVDADHDGMGHISPLLQAFFYRFWPRLFSEGRIHIVQSPILIVHQKGKKDLFAYDYESAAKLKKENPNGYFRYIKGLGSLELEEYRDMINNPRLLTVKIDDPKQFEIMFGDDSDLRKKLIMS